MSLKLKLVDLHNTNQLLVGYNSVSDFLKWFNNTVHIKKRSPFAYTFIFIDEGNGQCTINDTTLILAPQHLIIINSFATLAFTDIEKIEGRVIYFEEIFFSKTPQLQKYLWRILSESVKQPVLYISQPGATYDYLKSQIDLFGEQYTSDQKLHVRFAKMHDILSNIIILVNLKIEEASDAVYIKLRQSRVRHFLELLDTHFINERTLDFYASAMQISVQRLNLICLETLGMNARRLLEERLLSETKRLLLYEYRTVNEVCHILGFKNPKELQHFFSSKSNSSAELFLHHYRDLLPDSDLLHNN